MKSIKLSFKISKLTLLLSELLLHFSDLQLFFSKIILKKHKPVSITILNIKTLLVSKKGFKFLFKKIMPDQQFQNSVEFVVAPRL